MSIGLIATIVGVVAAFAVIVYVATRGSAPVSTVKDGGGSTTAPSNKQK